MDITLIQVILLLVTGFLAGIINTLAGGGSNLTLPALMLMGMPAEVANATNRLGVLMQAVTAVAGFKRHKKMESDDIIPILIPSVIGGLLGAGAAAYMPSSLIKPLLLGTMLTMAFVMLVKPSVIAPEPGTPVKKVMQTPHSWWGLGMAGFYGGFVQAGVGFVLLAALAGTLRYDLVRANALKMLCTLVFTLVALVLFIAKGLVLWVPGLILAFGTMFGAHIAVNMAIKAKASTLKWFLFVMTLCGCIAAMLH
ncbi:sulfite exporter TauE/SafE family protein [Photobacterium lipolyticum]|uniref:Probable membrane transporter protein n=1 Tax=Photobacterium lipolyticum TaxID=266810 RepID=A0A2T3MUR7_9GAMM|nr:sulfite exporter TauE/SafE family protein [Photobacterium lipolyticum]PSW03710.1 sulfite exporter TauE/SafE family protein [Photobacterium lipolyticum]